jgi:hypothetical protein
MLDKASWSCSLPGDWRGVQKIVFHKVGKFSARILIKDLKKLFAMHAVYSDRLAPSLILVKGRVAPPMSRRSSS